MSSVIPCNDFDVSTDLADDWDLPGGSLPFEVARLLVDGRLQLLHLGLVNHATFKQLLHEV